MQGHAALLKREIEAKLANRIPAALSPIVQPAPRLLPVSHAQLDALLGGGLPLGSVCELTGPAGSGRSSIALSLLASASCDGACAYVDASDSFSPRSAAAAGVDLGNLLWVRFAPMSQVQPATFKPAPALPQAEPHFHSDPAQQQNGGSPHPRGEAKGLAPALEQMLFSSEERRRRRMEGTPGCANQPLGLATASEDRIHIRAGRLPRSPSEHGRCQRSTSGAASPGQLANAAQRQPTREQRVHCSDPGRQQPRRMVRSRRQGARDTGRQPGLDLLPQYSARRCLPHAIPSMRPGMGGAESA